MCPIIRIFGYPIGTYGLCMILGFACIGVGTVMRGKRLGIRWEDVMICGALAIGVGLCCGNLLYLLVTYPPEALFDRLRRGEFEMFQEGFVFYGGMIGGFLGAVLGSRIAGCSGKKMLEAALPVIPFAHGIGRIGCLMAGCCHGMPYSGPLAVTDALTGATYFPVPLLEAAANCAIGLCLIYLARRKKGVWELLWVYLSLYSVVRFLLEFLRGDAIRGIAMGLSTSQWISLGILTLGAASLLRKVRK